MTLAHLEFRRLPKPTFTVLTCNSRVASSSTTSSDCGWSCNAESVYMWLTPPSIHFRKATALCGPVTTITISRASSTVCTPTVSAIFGTFETSLLKNLELARMVSSASVLTRVLDASDDPGSLKAMWPSGPTPPRNNSMPPAF